MRSGVLGNPDAVVRSCSIRIIGNKYIISTQISIGIFEVLVLYIFVFLVCNFTCRPTKMIILNNT